MINKNNGSETITIKYFSIFSGIGGDATLPVDVIFDEKEDAKRLSKWLNKKDNYIDRLELIVEMETNADLDRIREEILND